MFSIINIICINCVKISQLFAFSFYPNPITSGFLNIQMNKNYQRIIVKIMDDKGSILMQQSYLNTQQLRFLLPPNLKGLCLLEIHTDKDWEVQKILINN